MPITGVPYSRLYFHDFTLKMDPKGIKFRENVTNFNRHLTRFNGESIITFIDT